MVYTPYGFTDESSISPTTPAPAKKPSARKSLCLFTIILDVKKKTDICLVGAAKSKRKAIKHVNIPRQFKQKRKVHTKINDQIKMSFASPTSCAITNCQLLSESKHWWSHWTATGSNIVAAGLHQRTSEHTC